MTQALEAIDCRDIWAQTDDTCHLNGTARMGDDPRTSVVDADCRSWDIPQSVGLRWVGVSDRRRGESVAHDSGDCLPYGRPDPHVVIARRIMSAGIVVVTGGSAGVGRATVEAFAQAGWDVGIIARGQRRLDAAVAAVERMGRRACAVSADVADADAVERAADTIEQALGPIDVWVNNAMATVFGPVSSLTQRSSSAVPRSRISARCMARWPR